MRRRSGWVSVGVVMVAGWLALSAGRALWGWLAEPAAPPRLTNQLWLERLPRHERDFIHHLVLIEQRDNPRLGATGRSSRWRVHFDVFRWSAGDGRVRLTFPQDRHRLDLGYRTTECAGKAPAPFELCLELTRQGRGGTKTVRFYSRKDWRVQEDGAATDEALGAAPALPALLTGIATTGAQLDDDADTEADDDASAEPSTAAEDHEAADWDWQPAGAP